MNWLKDLKYIWKCLECPKTIIAVDKPDCSCGSSMYLQRCAEQLGMINSDSLNDLQNPVDGKTYDSKSAYYKAVSDAGCNIVEDNPLERKRQVQGDFDVSKELKDAVQQYEAKTGKSL